MVNINVLDVTQRCYNNNDGQILKNVLIKHLRTKDIITLSFDGINGLNSSFVNSAFIELLNDFSFDYIKKHLKFTNGNKQIYDIIKRRFDFESTKRAC